MDELRGKLMINGIQDDSIVDGPGMRFAIFTQGCPHHCPGCHNPQTHSFDGGTEVSLQSLLNEICENPLLEGVTFSGGEPFCQPGPLVILGRKVKEKGLDLVTFSGFTYEQLQEKAKKDQDIRDLLDLTDILVDGPFILAQINLELQFRGSENQRVIDLQAMRKAGDMQKIIEWEEY